MRSRDRSGGKIWLVAFLANPRPIGRLLDAFSTCHPLILPSPMNGGRLLRPTVCHGLYWVGSCRRAPAAPTTGWNQVGQLLFTHEHVAERPHLVHSPKMCKVRLAAAAATLVKQGLSVAVAESSAGGLISADLLAQTGASRWYRGGVVCYSKTAKSALLGLHEPQSKPTATEPHALELALAVREKLGADIGIGETGVAGPSANGRGIAPGVCALAVVGPHGSFTTTLWPDDGLDAADAYGQAPKLPRPERMSVFSTRAIEMLCDAVEKHGD